jgi:hypothetical protein
LDVYIYRAVDAPPFEVGVAFVSLVIEGGLLLLCPVVPANLYLDVVCLQRT